MDWFYVFIGELLGTAILVILGNGVVATAILKNSKGNKNSSWVMISVGWASAIFVAVMITKALGAPGYINPAVAIGDVIADANSSDYDGGLKALFSIPVSLVGAMLGQAFLYVVFLDAYKLEEDHGLVLATHSTGPLIRNYRNNFLTELFATLIFVGAIFSIGLVEGKGLGDDKELTKQIALTGLQTLSIAFILLAVGISLGGPTGYALNPARDLGPRIVHHLRYGKTRSSDWAYSWVPVFGPLAGGALAGIIKLLVDVI